MDFLRQQKYNFPFSCYIYWLCLLCFDLWHVLSDILIILLFMTFSLNRQLDLCCLQPVLWQVQIRFPLSFPFVSSWKNGLINFFADKPFNWWNDERGLSFHVFVVVFEFVFVLVFPICILVEKWADQVLCGQRVWLMKEACLLLLAPASRCQPCSYWVRGQARAHKNMIYVNKKYISCT